MTEMEEMWFCRGMIFTIGYVIIAFCAYHVLLHSVVKDDSGRECVFILSMWWPLTVALTFILFVVLSIKNILKKWRR